ncbi:UDP-glucose dehydrogenase family protein [Nocardioides taihuensis]|uniref:UDP-glucose 6-dehydrogenase n=1 Tax=Nocardioides taihuensis TaxID=1835606 RepID=A0ABW0BF60_9ACTN
MTSIAVVGCGYLGAVHAACMAELGHEVVGLEVDLERVASLNDGRAPFHEPGLDDLLARGLASGRLSFTADPAAIAEVEVAFICVGTPQRRGELAADVSHVDAATATVAAHVTRAGALVVGKSTVPVGTAPRLAEELARTAPHLELAWNPEFLREGHAVDDTLEPDRLVLGVTSERAEAVLREVYATPIAGGTPVVVTDFATAELAKVAANSFLATKISFINAMAELCEAAGGDVVLLADAIGHDKRIGRSFLNAGLGFGGGCLPKDIRAFMARAGEVGADQALTFLREVDAINMRRRSRMVDLAIAGLGGSAIGRRVGVLGAAFKPHSDDIRDSPALNVAAQLQLQGADVVITDPEALDNARRLWPGLSYASTAQEACEGVDIVLLLTEWPEYVGLDPDELGTVVRRRHVLDGRNALDVRRWQAAGWDYRALGRPHV